MMLVALNHECFAADVMMEIMEVLIVSFDRWIF